MKNVLWPEGVPLSSKDYDDELPILTPYLLKSSQLHGAIIVCPGGGYHHHAAHEGEPVARWLNSIGISAFVLQYRVAPYVYPAPMLDAKRAIRYVRYHAQKWNLHPEKIGILGFSAGGHLASVMSTQFDEGNANSSDPIERLSSRPDVSILCYPVISFTQHCHEGSVINLLGENNTSERQHLLSNERNVSPHTPPTFLWHTSDDASVPVQNSLLYAQALSEKRIPYELHIFPNGRHGLGLAAKDPIVSSWPHLCQSWLKEQGF
ncbi:alpha/beta hydrolase [Bacillus sp. AK128]